MIFLVLLGQNQPLLLVMEVFTSLARDKPTTAEMMTHEMTGETRMTMTEMALPASIHLNYHI